MLSPERITTSMSDYVIRKELCEKDNWFSVTRGVAKRE
jgi:hypothetical protein